MKKVRTKRKKKPAKTTKSPGGGARPTLVPHITQRLPLHMMHALARSRARAPHDAPGEAAEAGRDGARQLVAADGEHGGGVAEAAEARRDASCEEVCRHGEVGQQGEAAEEGWQRARELVALQQEHRHESRQQRDRGGMVPVRRRPESVRFTDPGGAPEQAPRAHALSGMSLQALTCARHTAPPVPPPPPPPPPPPDGAAAARQQSRRVTTPRSRARAGDPRARDEREAARAMAAVAGKNGSA